MKLTNEDMLPNTSYVPSGVVEIMKKQSEGYAYIRPKSPLNRIKDNPRTRAASTGCNVRPALLSTHLAGRNHLLLQSAVPHPRLHQRIARHGLHILIHRAELAHAVGEKAEGHRREHRIRNSILTEQPRPRTGILRAQLALNGFDARDVGLEFGGHRHLAATRADVHRHRTAQRHKA